MRVSVGIGHPQPRPSRKEAMMEDGQGTVENLHSGAVWKDSELRSHRIRSISRTITRKIK